MDGSPTHLLFVCRHGAAKSALAAEIARRRAAELGLAATATARGLAPESTYSPHLGDALPGFVAAGRPQPLKGGDLADATAVITFDIDPSELPGDADPLRWDGLPAVSEDPNGARRAIELRIAELLPDPPAD